MIILAALQRPLFHPRPSLASGFMQIMVLLTSALRAERPSELRLQALEGWSVLVKALTVAAPLQFAGILNQAIHNCCGEERWATTAYSAVLQSRASMSVN